jgi:hypothetical protein
MLVTKLTDGTVTIGGYKFEKDVQVEVPDRVADYIKNTFNDTQYLVEDSPKNDVKLSKKEKKKFNFKGD